MIMGYNDVIYSKTAEENMVCIIKYYVKNFLLILNCKIKTYYIKIDKILSDTILIRKRSESEKNYFKYTSFI